MIIIRAKCHNCGMINELQVKPIGASGKIEITFACIDCGACNEFVIDFDDPEHPQEDWLCLPPTGFEWSLPSGKITPVLGNPIYISAIGEHLFREDYIYRYKVDPEIAYQYMRRNPDIQKASKNTGKPSQSNSVHFQPDVKNIETIEVLCKICGAISRLEVDSSISYHNS